MVSPLASMNRWEIKLDIFLFIVSEIKGDLTNHMFIEGPQFYSQGGSAYFLCVYLPGPAVWEHSIAYHKRVSTAKALAGSF